MILIKPSYEILNVSVSTSIPMSMETFIESIGRVCYKSEDKAKEGSAEKFINGIISSGHESVIEHGNITVKFICDRGVTHELVRHRLVAYSQESTRYCNYKGGVTFIIPPWINIEPGEYTWKDIYETIFDFNGDQQWAMAMENAESIYIGLLKLGWSPQQARSVLPNSLKTEIVATTNIREWRHILKLRTSSKAHPQIREIMFPLLSELQDKLPVFFKDIKQE